ncbi:unnamed protein product [Blepharisma stoltei]|uniref:Uncharacterized protein n=1 Tax=Blepharisma stoltei TaxID=1481888 RepID=A0AAU9K1P4_9CILI|nr:unnamed protein product [Blepharisma stoltei]
MGVCCSMRFDLKEPSDNLQMKRARPLRNSKLDLNSQIIIQKELVIKRKVLNAPKLKLDENPLYKKRLWTQTSSSVSRNLTPTRSLDNILDTGSPSLVSPL